MIKKTNLPDALDLKFGDLVVADMCDDDAPEAGTELARSDLDFSSVVSDDGFQKYLRQINAIPSLSKEEEFMLAKNYLEHNDVAAAQKLVTSHLKLVVKIALQYKNYNLPVPDLVSEGTFGLMKAVKKYDLNLGYRLSTYAMWWIKAAIQEYILRSWSLVKVGTAAAQRKLFFGLHRAKNKLSSVHGRDINFQDYAAIASDLGVSSKEVEEMTIRLSNPDISLNTPLADSAGSAKMEDIIATETPNQEVAIIESQLASNKNSTLMAALSTLHERELKILKARKLSEVPRTLGSLSAEYGISGERVRQIENVAYEKVRVYVLSRVSSDGVISDRSPSS